MHMCLALKHFYATLLRDRPVYIHVLPEALRTFGRGVFELAELCQHRDLWRGWGGGGWEAFWMGWVDVPGMGGEPGLRNYVGSYPVLKQSGPAPDC